MEGPQREGNSPLPPSGFGVKNLVSLSIFRKQLLAGAAGTFRLQLRRNFTPFKFQSPTPPPSPWGLPWANFTEPDPLLSTEAGGVDPAPSCQVCVSRVEIEAIAGEPTRSTGFPFHCSLSLSSCLLSLSCLSCGLSSAWKTWLPPASFLLSTPSLLPSSKILQVVTFQNYFKSALRSGFLF